MTALDFEGELEYLRELGVIPYEYHGNITYVEGRGEILVTLIPLDCHMPKKGEKIKVYGRARIVQDIEVAMKGNKRAETVGILLRDNSLELEAEFLADLQAVCKKHGRPLIISEQIKKFNKI